MQSESSLAVPFHEEDSSFPVPADVPGILASHGYDTGIDAWLRYQYVDPDEIRAAVSIGEMRGLWRQCAGFPFPATFRPFSAARSRAVVVPLYVGGDAVDILAMDKADMGLWGVVTGAAAFVNDDAITRHRIGSTLDPLRVHRRPWPWLLAGCAGIIPLGFDAYPALYNRRVYRFLAEDIEHAEDLVERIFENSVTAAQTEEEHRLANAEFRFRSAIAEGRVLVEDEALADEIVDRAVHRLAAEARQ
jgi:hypothetical protein